MRIVFELESGVEVLGVDCAVCRMVDAGVECGEVDQVGNDRNTSIGHTCRF